MQFFTISAGRATKRRSVKLPIGGLPTSIRISVRCAWMIKLAHRWHFLFKRDAGHVKNDRGASAARSSIGRNARCSPCLAARLALCTQSIGAVLVVVVVELQPGAAGAARSDILRCPVSTKLGALEFWGRLLMNTRNPAKPYSGFFLQFLSSPSSESQAPAALTHPKAPSCLDRGHHAAARGMS